MAIYTRTAADVYNPLTLGGQPRGADMAEARLYHIENEGVTVGTRNPVTTRFLTVQPRIAASMPEIGLFKTIAEARAWIIANPPVGDYQPTHIELAPANYGNTAVVLTPGQIMVGSARETATFQDRAGGPLIDLGVGFTVIENMTIWGNNNPGSFSVSGTNTQGVYLNVDMLSDGGITTQGNRRSKGLFLGGTSKNILVDGSWDFDADSADPQVLIDLLGAESDIRFGYRGQMLIDAFYQVNGAIFRLNRTFGVVFQNVKIRGNLPGGGVGTGSNTTPVEMTHLLPDGVTLAPGESLSIIETGCSLFGAALRIRERCRMIVQSGVEWPGLSADSRGVAQVTKETGAVVIRPGPARFAWRNAGGNAFAALSRIEARTGKLTVYANGRAGGTVLLHMFEDVVSTIPATNRQVIANLVRAQALNRVGHRTGIYLRQDSLGNRHIFFGTRDGTRLVIERGTSDTNIDGAALFDWAMTEGEFRLRVLEFGGTRFYDIAIGDGEFTNVFFETSTAYLTFDRTGIAVDGECIGGTFRPQAQITVDDWYVGV
jgi:hypothetical protein